MRQERRRDRQERSQRMPRSVINWRHTAQSLHARASAEECAHLSCCLCVVGQQLRGAHKHRPLWLCTTASGTRVLAVMLLVARGSKHALCDANPFLHMQPAQYYKSTTSIAMKKVAGWVQHLPATPPTCTRREKTIHIMATHIYTHIYKAIHIMSVVVPTVAQAAPNGEGIQPMF